MCFALLLGAVALIAQSVPKEPPTQEIQWKVECPVCHDIFGAVPVPSEIKTNSFKSSSATVYNRTTEMTCPQCGTRFSAMHQKIVPDVMAEEVVVPSRQRLQQRLQAAMPPVPATQSLVPVPRTTRPGTQLIQVPFGYHGSVVSMTTMDEDLLLSYYRTNREYISLLMLTKVSNVDTNN